jgi:succinate dehydrogenase / fumarate reductase, membrane anchor subunit
MSLRSPIGRVLGLGAAKEGLGHWWAQRVTSVALVFLTLWFATAIPYLADASYLDALRWIGDPINAVLLLLLIPTLIYHSLLGVQVVVEDYVHHHGLKVASLLSLTFLHVLLAALAIFAVLRIAFTGPGTTM